MPRRKDPVLQHYQVEIRGAQYYVIDTNNGALVAGPYSSRTVAQQKADTLEKRRPHRG